METLENLREENSTKSYVFGISEPVKHKCYLEIVDDRCIDTLIEIITKHIPPTAKIIKIILAMDEQHTTDSKNLDMLIRL